MRYAVVLMLCLFSSLGFAQTKKGQRDASSAGQMTNELLDVRNKLEKEAQQNLENLIGTQLNPETFTVAVRVQISVIAPPEPKKEQAKSEETPAGLDLGVISAKELAESYERQLEELKLKKDIYNENKVTKYQINKIEVIVGLASTYDDEYFGKFKIWLADKVKKDYGKIALSGVTKLPKKYEPPKEEPVPEDPFQPKYMSVPLAAAFLAMALILVGFLLWSGLRKVATAAKPLEILPQGEFKIDGKLAGSEMLEDPTEELENLPAPRAEAYNLGDEIDRVTKKIAFVVLEIGTRINDLVRVWIDSGDQGFMKTALLVDTVLTAREKIMSETGNIAPLHIPLSEEIAKMYEENLAEAYRSLSDLTQEDQIQLLEKIYWDLVSVRTLGLQSLRRPFDFLQGISREGLTELLSTQRKEVKALAIMYLPEDTKADIMANLSEEDRDMVVQQALAQSHLSDKQIWDTDTSLKVATLNQSANPSEKLVNLFPRTVEVLQSLDILEEIRILRKVCPALQDNGLVVKQQVNTLAFVDEWKPEYLGKLVGNATAEEIVTLIRTVPDVKENLLSVCAEKIRIIVEDDLKLPPSKDESKTKAKLDSLRSKWNKIALAEQLPMSKVIIFQGTNKETSNAA